MALKIHSEKNMDNNSIKKNKKRSKEQNKNVVQNNYNKNEYNDYCKTRHAFLFRNKLESSSMYLSRNLEGPQCVNS